MAVLYNSIVWFKCELIFEWIIRDLINSIYLRQHTILWKKSFIMNEPEKVATESFKFVHVNIFMVERLWLKKTPKIHFLKYIFYLFFERHSFSSLKNCTPLQASLIPILASEPSLPGPVICSSGSGFAATNNSRKRGRSARDPSQTTDYRLRRRGFSIF